MSRFSILVMFIFFANVVISGQSKSLANFTSISTSGSVQVELVKGDTPKADYKIIKGKESDLFIDVKGGELEVKIKPKNSKWNRSQTKAKVTIYYQTITEVDCSAGSSISSTSEMDSKSLNVDASSGSNCSLQLLSNNVIVSASSGAKVSLNGSCSTAVYDASSGSNIDATYLTASIVDADVSSGARILLYASKKLNAEASSGGSIKYKGKPISTNIDSGKSGTIKSF